MDYLTGNEVAALLGVNRRTVYRWMENDKLGADEWTTERLLACREELLNPPKARPEPRCATCGTRDPSRFTPRPKRPTGYDGYCRACNAARMRRARMK